MEVELFFPSFYTVSRGLHKIGDLIQNSLKCIWKILAIIHVAKKFQLFWFDDSNRFSINVYLIQWCWFGGHVLRRSVCVCCMIAEVTHRLQTARPEVRQLLLQYLLPWLYNMELVDPNVPPGNPLSYFQVPLVYLLVYLRHAWIFNIILPYKIHQPLVLT